MAPTEDQDDYGYNPADRNRTTLQRRHSTCKAMVRFAMTFSPHAKQLLGAMEGSGCPLSLGHGLYCEDCVEKRSRWHGYFTPRSAGVVICQNNIRNQSQVNRTVVHELTHAFDHCLGRVDWRSLKHLACAEVRAYNLSGKCFTEQCVQRWAVTNMGTATKEMAEKAVAEVLHTCLGDRTPLGPTPPHGEEKNAFRDL